MAAASATVLPASIVLVNTTNGRNAIYEIRFEVGTAGLYCVRAYWGRIGARPQTKLLLTSATRDAAVRAADGKAAEKEARGYVRRRQPAPVVLQPARLPPQPAAPTAKSIDDRFDKVLSLAQPSVDVGI